MTELTGETYADVMRTALVGVVVLSPKQLGAERLALAVADVRTLALGWEKRGGKDGQRAVIWAWVDGDKWSAWAKSLYGVKATLEPVVVVADPKVCLTLCANTWVAL